MRERLQEPYRWIDTGRPQKCAYEDGWYVCTKALSSEVRR